MLMSAEIINDDGNILTFKVSGKLAQPELAAAQKSAVEILRKEGKKGVLVIADGFLGWGKGDWADLSDQAAMDTHIEKMAIVGDKKWEDLVTLFVGKGIRQVAIEFFAPADLARAREWLASA